MCDLPKSILVEHIHGASQPACKIKLIKQAKAWAWEISMSGEDFTSIVAKIEECNDVMKVKFGGVQSA